MFFTPIAICLGLGGLVLFAIILFKPKPADPTQQQAQNAVAQQQVQQQPLPAQQQNQKQIKEVSAKEIEAFESELRGIRVTLQGEFGQINQDFVKSRFGSNSNWIGFSIYDRNNNIYQYAITDKNKYGSTLLKTNSRTPIILIGKVEKYEGAYFFDVEEIIQE
jgi:hypothetical protein